MAKLYFKYGTMGSSKTAQALIAKFNYEEQGMKTILLKPAIDTRDGVDVCASRIGLNSRAIAVGKDLNLYEFVQERRESIDVVIVDECQFLTERQVDQLGDVVIDFDLPVLCFGLRTDFLTRMFPGSKRLFEIAESIAEIKYVCKCGSKATVNARIDEKGDIVTDGDQIYLGGNESYIPMCRKCYTSKIKRQKQKRK